MYTFFWRTLYILKILCKFNIIYQRIMEYMLLFTGFRDFFLQDLSWCAKIIYYSLDSVFTIAEPPEQRETFYGTCRLPVIGFSLSVMPFEMFHTSANYWLLTVPTQRFEERKYNIQNNKCKFWSFSFLNLCYENIWIWKTPGSRKKISGAIEVCSYHFLLSLSSVYNCTFITKWWPEDYSYNT